MEIDLFLFSIPLHLSAPPPDVRRVLRLSFFEGELFPSAPKDFTARWAKPSNNHTPKACPFPTVQWPESSVVIPSP